MPLRRRPLPEGLTSVVARAWCPIVSAIDRFATSASRFFARTEQASTGLGHTESFEPLGLHFKETGQTKARRAMGLAATSVFSRGRDSSRRLMQTCLRLPSFARGG